MRAATSEQRRLFSKNPVTEYLKAMRIEAKMTQTDLAKKMGLSSQQFISNTERGLCNYAITHIVMICRILKIDTSEAEKMYLLAITTEAQEEFKLKNKVQRLKLPRNRK